MSVEERSFDPSEFNYRAFISYSRADTEFVDDFYKRLTRFRTPGSLQEAGGSYGMLPRSFRVFLDRMSIEAGGTVPDGIKRKLQESAFLIVVCSGAARDSFWVNEEIRYFLSIAPPARILPVILRANAETPLEDVIPAPLLDLKDAMPIGADTITDGGISSVRDKIIGGLLGIAQDRVAGEQERADRNALRRRTMALAAISVLFLVSSLAGILAWTARNDALSSESRSLARASTHAATQQWQPDLGMLLALQALPRDPGGLAVFDRPYETQAALALSTGIFWQGVRKTIGSVSTSIIYDSPAIAVSADRERWLYAHGSRLEIWDAATSTRLLNTELDDVYGAIIQARFSLDGERLAVVTDPKHFLIMSAATGEILTIGETAPSPYGEITFRPGKVDVLIAKGASGLWIADTGSGALKRRLEGHTRQIQRSEYTQDGALIVTMAGDRSIRIWDADTGEQVSAITTEAHMGYADFAVAPDQSFMIAATDDELYSLTFPDLELTHTIRKSGRLIDFDQILLSPDGAVLAITEGEDIALRKASDLTEIHLLEGHREAVSNLAFSADGALLASTGLDKTLRLWHVRTAAEIAQYVGKDRPFNRLFFTAAGIVASGRDEAAYFWDRTAAIPIATLQGHENAVQSIAFNADGSQLVSASADFTVKLWDVASASLIHPFGENRSHRWIVLGARFDGAGGRVLSVGEDGNAIAWNTQTGAEIWATGADDTIRDGVFSQSGRYVAVASADHSIGVIDAETGTVKFQSDAHEGGARGVEFSPDERELMSYGSDGKIRFWNVETGAERLKIDAHGLGATTARYSPDGSKVVSGSGGGGEGIAMIFDVESGDTVARLYPHGGVVRQALFTDDGTRVLTAAADGIARLWDIESQSVLTSVSSNQRDLSDVDISPDGRRFVTTAFRSNGPSAVLWDLETGQRIADYYGQTQTVLDVEFAPLSDDQTMKFATAGYDGAIEIWEAPLPNTSVQLKPQACAALAETDRSLTRQEALQFGISWPPPSVC